jgi:putative NADPH-quinone reductase
LTSQHTLRGTQELGMSQAASGEGRRILVIQGHPDAFAPDFCHALQGAYEQGAAAGGHHIRSVNVAQLDFPILRSQQAWEAGELPPALTGVQTDLTWAEHVVIFFPLWLGDMPALLKAFLEQVARPGFAFKGDADNPFAEKPLTGRSARVVVTMGMPALVYRWYFRAHGVKSLERNILRFVGMSPVHETLIGSVGKPGAGFDEAGRTWLETLRKMGATGD